MPKISDLSDELLVKILSFLPTKEAVSTSILSKQWEFLWMWCPDLKFSYCYSDSVRDFISKNLPLHRAPIINSLSLSFRAESFQADDSKSWTGIALSRGLRKLSISSFSYSSNHKQVAVYLFSPKSLYTSKSLVSLYLNGKMISVDVPRTVCLPSLETLQLTNVAYSNEDSLQLLLSGCPILEDLTIEREWEDNLKALVIKVPSLQRLSIMDDACSHYGCVIITPSLKYLRVEDHRNGLSYMIEHMPELEEADIFLLNGIYVDQLLKSIKTVKRLSVYLEFNNKNEIVYGDGIVFNQLEKLEFYICSENWSKILCQLLKDSPNLQILDIEIESCNVYEEYEPVSWITNHSLVPECLLKSLKTFKFRGSTEEQEERDFLSFIFRHACCLKSTSFLKW